MKAFFRISIYGPVLALLLVTASCTYSYDPYSDKNTAALAPAPQKDFTQQIEQVDKQHRQDYLQLKRQIDSSHLLLRTQLALMNDSISAWHFAEKRQFAAMHAHINHLTNIVYAQMVLLVLAAGFVAYRFKIFKNIFRRRAVRTIEYTPVEDSAAEVVSINSRA